MLSQDMMGVQAYDLVTMAPSKPRGARKSPPVAKFARAALSGLICYSQWMQAVRVGTSCDCNLRPALLAERCRFHARDECQILVIHCRSGQPSHECRAPVFRA